MATARELLEQADALMRRNRASGDARAGARIAAARVPGEMRIVDTEPGVPAISEATPAPAGERTEGAAAAAAAGTARPDAVTEDDFPILTDAVTDLEPISVLGSEDSAEPSRWPDAPPWDRRDVWHVHGPEADASQTRIDPALDRDAAQAPPVAPEPAAEAEDAVPLGVDLAEDAPAAPAEAAERRDALADEVRMQVLQRLDIFTDTGLQEQLGVRLQPIVDRASADLVAAINQHLGALLRAYVAEAIEREIEKLRGGS